MIFDKLSISYLLIIPYNKNASSCHCQIPKQTVLTFLKLMVFVKYVLKLDFVIFGFVFFSETVMKIFSDDKNVSVLFLFTDTALLRLCVECPDIDI